MSFEVVYGLNFLSRKWTEFVRVCLCVCAIDMDCSIMHSPPDHKQGSCAAQPTKQPGSQLEVKLHAGTFPLSVMYLLVQKPQRTHRSYSLEGAISADRVHQGQ